jgi:hypothetical protein
MTVYSSDYGAASALYKQCRLLLSARHSGVNSTGAAFHNAVTDFSNARTSVERSCHHSKVYLKSVAAVVCIHTHADALRTISKQFCTPCYAWSMATCATHSICHDQAQNALRVLA